MLSLTICSVKGSFAIQPIVVYTFGNMAITDGLRAGAGRAAFPIVTGISNLSEHYLYKSSVAVTLSGPLLQITGREP